jgi:carbamoyl-phosphate synthase large subunit
MRITILRTAVGSPPAMGLITELKKKKVRIIGVDCDPVSAGLYLCDKGYVVPRGDDPRFLSEILKICDVEKPNMIISGPEEEVLTLSKNKKLFDERDVLLLCPNYKTVKICADKFRTWENFKKLSVPVPQIYRENDIEFPCIIKPRWGRGSQKIFKVNTPKELKLFLKKVENPVIQEYVSGIECTIDTFADLKGRPLSIVPRIRLQVESGISIKGMTVYDEQIINYCQKIVKRFKLVGPACIQCIKTEKEVKFTEVNTRFGGGSILSIKADPSILGNLIEIAKGNQPTPSKGFKEGLVMLRYYSEIFIPKNKLLGRLVF